MVTEIAEAMTVKDMTTAETLTIIVKSINHCNLMPESWCKGDIVILVTLKMIVRPERRSDLLETMRGMLEPARVERGCLSYRLYGDVEDRNAFVLLETWATQEDLESHIRTDNQMRLLALMDFLSEKPEFLFNTVSHTAGMDLIKNVLTTDGARDVGGVRSVKNNLSVK
jgi:quinol monooxygenase YgiN